MTKEIYRGYDIESSPNGGYVIKLKGVTVSYQPSLEFCYKFIDNAKRKA